MTEGYRRAEGAVLGRLARSWRANIGKLNFPLLAIGGLATLLPHDMFNFRRASLYRVAGVRVGRNVQILGPLTLVTAGGWGNKLHYLEIGDESAIDVPCTMTLVAPLRIGSGVHIGRDALILTGTHHVAGAAKRCGAYRFAAVEIGDGCWLGVRVVILPGVTIGPGSVVAAGAVVTRSMPANSTIAGNPARVVGRLDQATSTVTPGES